MSVKIRLRRTGRKKQPSYRLVVADTASPRDGQYLDALGTYNPLVKPAHLRIDLEKVDKWLANGAGMSDTAASLIRKARQGGDSKVAVSGVGPEAKPEVADVVAAAEPSKASKPSRPGSRGAPKAEAVTAPAAVAEAVAEAPAVEAPAAEAPAAEAPAAEAPAAEVPAAEVPAAEAPVAEAPAADSSEGAEPAEASE